MLTVFTTINNPMVNNGNVWIIFVLFYHLVVTTVSFGKSSYVISKTAKSPRVTLVLNNSLSDTLMLQVLDGEGTAFSKLNYIVLL